MFRRFLEGADERLPCLAETKTNLSVHIVGMELNLNGLPDDAIQVSYINIFNLNIIQNSITITIIVTKWKQNNF
jgi:hypothetical protein